jgi:hypothetical protein
MSLYLETDPLSGAVSTLDYDHDADVAVIKRVADVQPVIDRNKELLNHGTHTKTPGELDMRLAASIPIEVCYLWLQKYGIQAWKKEHWDAVKKLLNSNEWKYLRTSELYL